MEKNFEMIAGYGNLKKDLQEICKVLQNAEKFKSMGLHMPKGILLTGEPGVGKTVMAEALINESKLNCVRIDFDAVDEDELSDYLQDKFTEAIEKGPSIILMDEIDKVCGEDNPFRPISNMDTSRKVLKAINDNQSDNIMLLAIINDKDMMMPAICRAGRFDRTIEIPLPSLEDRKEIIKLYAKNKKFDKKVDFDTFAKITGSMSGADIETIINESGLNAIVNGREIIKQEDIDRAVNRIIFKGPEKKEIDIRNKQMVATHEVGHLIAGLLLDKDNVGSITIIPQGEAEGHVKIGVNSDSIKTKTEVLNRVIIGLAGKASEQVFYPNEDFLGSGYDIKKALSLINMLVTVDCCYGFEYLVKIKQNHFDDVIMSEDKIIKIEQKCDEVLNECLEKAKRLIAENIDLATIFIKKLTSKYTLTREEILKIYNKFNKNKKATLKKIAQKENIMKNFVIEDVKCGVGDGGMSCGFMLGSAITYVKFNDGEQSHYLYNVEFDGRPSFYLYEKDIFESLVNEEETEDTEKFYDDCIIDEFEGVALSGEYSDIFESLKESGDQAVIALIKYIIALTRCEYQDIKQLISLGKGKNVAEITIPMSDVEEEYLEEYIIEDDEG